VQGGPDMTAYLQRLQDLDSPLPEDDPMWLAARPDPGPPAGPPAPRQPAKLGPVLSEEDKERLRAEYRASTGLPATVSLEQFGEQTTEVIPGRAWVVLDLLSPSECEELIQEAEGKGLKPPGKGEQVDTQRQNLRTDNWIRPDLSAQLAARLPESLLGPVEHSPPYTSVRGIHSNWRVSCYRPGHAFPAHYDQADSVMVQHKEHVRQRYTSSHTLLIYLRPRDESFTGGATRFFQSGSYTADTLDIALPQGAGLVFQQRGQLHAGLPVSSGEKWIAQAGLLRGEPHQFLGPLSIFKYGPGLQTY